MTKLRALYFSVLLLVAAAGPLSGPRAADAYPAASSFIQTMGSQAIQELTGPNVPQHDREVRFRKLLDSHFDMAAIAKFVLGRYWRTATDAERADFQKLFEDYIVQSYAVRFGDYSGERFEVSGSSGAEDDIVIVHSKIDRTGAEDVRLDWRLHRADGSFAVVDIIVEGVSMEVTQRSQFASMIQDRGGVDGLIAALRGKNPQSADSSIRQ